MTAARDVAALINDLIPGQVGEKKMHKLLYYVQGYHLAWHDRPAFEEDIHAYEHGPVVHLYRAARVHRWDVPDPEPLDDATIRDVTHMVVQRFGRLTGNALGKRTHEEDPWIEAWANAQSDDPWTNDVIYNDPLRKYFSDPALTDEQRRSLGLDTDLSAAWENFVPDPPGAIDAFEAMLNS